MASEEDLLGYKDYEDLPELDPGEEDDLLALDDDDDLGQKHSEFVDYDLHKNTAQNASAYGSQEEEDVLDLAVDGDLEIEDNDVKERVSERSAVADLEAENQDCGTEDELKNESSDSEDDAASGRGRFKSERMPNVVSVTSAKKRSDIPDNLDFVDIHEDVAKAEDFVRSDKLRHRGRGRGGNRNYRGARDQRMNRSPGVPHRRFPMQQRPIFPFPPVVNFPAAPYHQIQMNQLSAPLELRLPMSAPPLPQQHSVKPSNNVHINPHFRGAAPQRPDAPKVWDDARLTSPSVIQNPHAATPYQQLNTSDSQHHQQFASQQGSMGTFQVNRPFTNETPGGYSDQTPTSNFQTGQMGNSQTFYQDKQQFSSDGPFHQFDPGSNREAYSQPQDVNRNSSYVERPLMNQEAWQQQQNQISSVYGRVPPNVPNAGNFNQNAQPQQQYLSVWQNPSVPPAFTNQPPPSQHMYTPNQVPNMSFNQQAVRPGMQHHPHQQQRNQNQHKQQVFRQRQQRGRQQQQQQQQKQHHPHTGQSQFSFKPEVSSWQQPHMMTEKMFQSFSKSAGSVLTVIEPLPEHQFNALNKLQLKQKRQQRFQGGQPVGGTSTAGNKKRPSDEFLGSSLKKLKGIKSPIHKRMLNKNIREIQIVDTLPSWKPAVNLGESSEMTEDQDCDTASNLLASLNAPIEKAALPIEDEEDEETRRLRLLIEEQKRIREKVMRQKEANRRLQAAEQRRKQESNPLKNENETESGVVPILVNQNKDLGPEPQPQETPKVSVKERLFLSKHAVFQQKVAAGRVATLNAKQELNVTPQVTQQVPLSSQGNQIRPVLATSQMRKRIGCTSQPDKGEIIAKRPALGQGVRGRLGIRKVTTPSPGAASIPGMHLTQPPSVSVLANQESSCTNSISVSNVPVPTGEHSGSVVSRGRARGLGRGRVIGGRGLLRGISQINKNVGVATSESQAIKNSSTGAANQVSGQEIVQECVPEGKSGNAAQEETVHVRNSISPITAPSPAASPKQISRIVLRGHSGVQSRPLIPSVKQLGLASQRQARTPIPSLRPQAPGAQTAATSVRQQSVNTQQQTIAARQRTPITPPQAPGGKQVSPNTRPQAPGMHQWEPSMRQQAPGARQQASGIRLKTPTGTQQLRGFAHQQLPGVVRQPTPGVVRQPSPGAVRQPSPGTLRHPSPGPVRQPSPGALRHPSPGPVRQSSPGAVQQQSLVFRHPTPSIRPLATATRQMAPGTRQLTPGTPQSSPGIRRSSPGIRQPSSSICQPSSGVRQPSPGICQPSPAVRHPSSGIRHPSVGIRQPSPGSRQPAPGIRQPTPGIRQPIPGIRQPTPGIRQPTPGIRQPTPGIRQPTPGIRQPTPGIRQTSPGIRQTLPGIRQSSPGIRQAVPSMRQPNPGMRQPSPGFRPQAPSAQKTFHSNEMQKQSTASPASRSIGDQKTPQVLSASPSKLALVENLAAATSKEQLLKMCQGIGAVESIEHSKPERKAVVKFMNSTHAEQFMKKYQRRMVDLSLINVSLLSS